MPVFQYTVEGHHRKTIAADSPRQARQQLRSQGIAFEDLVEETGRGGKRFSRRASSSSAKLTATIRELSTLLAAGIGLVQALDILAKQHRGSFQTSLHVLRDQVAAGSSLAESMRNQPGVFDELTIQMVEVGENSGTLDAVLDQLADFQDRSLQFKDRVFTALLYPSIVVAISIGVSIFLMTVVLPMLLENLLEAGKTLPWPTRILKGASDTLRTHGWWISSAARRPPPAGERFWRLDGAAPGGPAARPSGSTGPPPALPSFLRRVTGGEA